MRRRAECTSLSPASYCASFPHRSASCFGVSLRARGCCGLRFRLCGAAQRYLFLFWTAPSAPRSSSSATDEEWPLCAAKCSGVDLHGRRRRRLGRRTQRPIRRERKRRTRTCSGRSRRRRHRRAIGSFGDCRDPPHSAARSSHTCARRGRGAGVGPTGVPQYPTGTRKTKQQARPEGRLYVLFWVTVNGREYSERTLSTRHLAPRSRIHQTWQTSESSGNGDCGRTRRREIMRLGKTAGEPTSHGT